MRCVSIKLRCVSIKLTFWNTHIKDNTSASQISNHTQVFRGSKDNKKKQSPKSGTNWFLFTKLHSGQSKTQNKNDVPSIPKGSNFITISTTLYNIYLS